MMNSPLYSIIGFPAAGLLVGIVLSYGVRCLQRSIALEDAREAQFKRESRVPNIVYAQPTSLPVDATTRIAMTVKAKNVAIRLDGGKYAFPPLELGHASAG
jgi:hypothetical protein